MRIYPSGNVTFGANVTVNGWDTNSHFKRKFDYNSGGWARTIIEYENSLMSSGNFKIGSYGGKTDYSYSYIGNGNYNDSKNMRIYPNGNVTFGGNAAIYGKLESKEIKVTNTPTADFVFEDNYNLPTLKSIEKHIKEKKHLPEIASAKEMEKNGVNVGKFQIQLLQKIEELTLYTIDQEKKLKSQKKKFDKQQKEIEELKALVQKLLKNKN